MRRAAMTATLLAGLALVGRTTPAEAALKVGDKAAEIKVAKWVKGTPVKEFAKGKVYVMEFWATWCGPCRVSIPHITEMAKKYKDKCTFTGVSVWERGEDTMKQVADFVKDMGDKMDYNVAADGTDKWMATNWMEAAGQDGIPAAFVIGKDGKIAWIGHPMDGLEDVVGDVIADKFDPKAVAERKARQEAEMNKMRSAMNSVVQLMQSGKSKEALTELNKVLAANPQFETQVAGFKFNLMLQADEAAAYPYARKLADGKFKDNAMMLNQIAWTIVDDKGQIKLKKPDYATAVFVAERAVAASKSEDPMILDTLGYALFKKGDIKKAIEIQTKAVKLLEDKKDIPEEARKEITDRLAMFKKKNS